ncbi:FAD/NAD(P)-binding domain-containing protein [Coprinopsis marcescibilis]|uniref:FAD/NAD(P)-binding domain-containing protein n=1 Tax=Coprinopsis marcescibilis TaxID=230819 RepID=A0A5C3KR32_COPMA|nr:FAD/NAD(P)-binding domain-containing protein [Coprinopsis marcescibilis]
MSSLLSFFGLGKRSSVSVPAKEKPAAPRKSEEPKEKTDSKPSRALSLDIIVIGAGIGGLSVAYLLGKAGHEVTVLENAAQLSEVGAGIQLSPNVTRLLNRWGLKEKLEEISVIPQELTLRRYENGEVVGWKRWGDMIEKDHGAPYYHIHRADLHKLLVETCEQYATIRLNSRVTDIDTSKPSVTLASGEVISADLVIGADGLHSKARDIVVGKKDNPQATGDAAYRSTIPAEKMQDDPDLQWLFKEPGVNVWMGPGRHVVGYFIRNKKLYNVVMLVPARDLDENVKDADVQVMRDDFKNFEPRLRKILDLVPSTMVWALKDRQPLDTWIHPEGRVCLLGDACHPMLPYRAQGAAMAIEDAAVLGNLLSRITSHDELESLLKGYQTLRHPRATATQTASRLNQHIFHLPDGPKQEARDSSMKEAMEVERRELNGEDISNNAGSSNLWADKERNKVAFDYDADEEVEKWWKQNNSVRA